MVVVIFCTETSRHANYSVSNQHWTSSSKPLQWIQCAEQIYIQMFKVVMLSTLRTNFLIFAHFALQSSPMKLYFWYLSCKHFPEISHQYVLFTPLFLHLKHFETSALLCVVKRILLDIGLNLRCSPVLQISNFPLTKKSCLLCETFSLKNFILSQNEAPKAHFCFLLHIQSSTGKCSLWDEG